MLLRREKELYKSAYPTMGKVQENRPLRTIDRGIIKPSQSTCPGIRSREWKRLHYRSTRFSLSMTSFAPWSRSTECNDALLDSEQTQAHSGWDMSLKTAKIS